MEAFVVTREIIWLVEKLWRVINFFNCENEHLKFSSSPLLDIQQVKLLCLVVESEAQRCGQENVKQLEECSKMRTWPWVFSVTGALMATPLTLKSYSLLPQVVFGTTGVVFDVMIGVKTGELEHAKRQRKLLEAQNSAADASQSDTLS